MMSHKHKEFIHSLLEHVNGKQDGFTFDELKAVLHQAEKKIPLCKNLTNTRKTKCTSYAEPGYDFCQRHLNGSKSTPKTVTKVDDRPPVYIDMNIEKRHVVKQDGVFTAMGTNIVLDEKGQDVGRLEGHHVTMHKNV